MPEGLAELLDLTEAGLVGFILVFTRVAVVVGLLPGFGERVIPARVRLAAAVAFAMVVWPMLAPALLATDPARPLVLMLIVEASIGKLYWSNWHRNLGELAMDVLGPAGQIVPVAGNGEYALDDLQRSYMFSRSETIAAAATTKKNTYFNSIRSDDRYAAGIVARHTTTASPVITHCRDRSTLRPERTSLRVVHPLSMLPRSAATKNPISTHCSVRADTWRSWVR